LLEQYSELEGQENITRILSGVRWPPLLDAESSLNRLKTRFFADKIHPRVSDSRTLAPEVRQITQAVCAYYGLDEPELAKSRRGWFNEPRAVAIHLARMMRKDCFPDITSAFGLRGYRPDAPRGVVEIIKKRLATDPDLGMRCQCIMKAIRTGHTET
jgi:hypothetical protein